jgi:starvation-inducible outer membrane lipoprotein
MGWAVMKLTFAAIAALMLSGCVSSPQPSQLGEMFAARARGEIACVRDGVLVRGREGCK